MNDWSNFYKDRVGESYAQYCRFRYKPMIRELLKTGGETFREEGCGIGTITKILSDTIDVDCLEMTDINSDMCNLAKRNTFNKIPVHKEDILNWQGIVDVIYSHGVLEHFSDNDIKRIIDRQKDDAYRAIIHYVPTDGYKEQSFGDERLMSVERWSKLINPTRTVLFNDGKDLLMIWIIKN